MKILILNGVNLNMFGKRDPKHYGTETLGDIDSELSKLAKELSVTVESFQTNTRTIAPSIKAAPTSRARNTRGARCCSSLANQCPMAHTIAMLTNPRKL